MQTKGLDIYTPLKTFETKVAKLANLQKSLFKKVGIPKNPLKTFEWQVMTFAQA